MPQEIIQGIAEAAKLLDVHRDTIHRHIKSGTFPSPISVITLGNKSIRVWSRETLDEWKKKQGKKEGRGWKIGKKRLQPNK